MFVVRQKDHLSCFGKSGQGFDPRPGTVDVVVDEEIVGDEGQGVRLFNMHLKGRQTQSEVQLIAGAVAHAGNADCLSVRAQAIEPGRFTLEIDDQFGERALCKAGENFTCPRQHGALFGFAVSVDGPAQ